MATNYEAFTPVSTRPVRTFNAKDLAEAYRDQMAAIGATIIIKTARVARRTA